MKTITKALRTFWDVSVGSCIGVLSTIAVLFALVVIGISDTKGRRALFEMCEDLYGEEDDDYTYTRKKKESE